MPWFDDTEKAYQDCSQAIEANPRDTKAILYRGAALQCLSRPDEAIADFARVVELIPPDTPDPGLLAILVEAHICLGVAVGRRSDPLSAVKEFSKALELNPNHHLAYYNRGISWSRYGESVKAIIDYSKTIEINPDYADAFLHRGLERRNIGDTQRSREDFAKVREFNNKARESNSRFRCGNRKRYTRA